MRVAVNLQPFLIGRRLQKPLKVAPRVQANPAPVTGRKERRFDLAVIGNSRSVKVVHPLAILGVEVGLSAVARQLFVTQCDVTSDRPAIVRIFFSALTNTVLHRLDLSQIPAAEEVAQDTAVTAQFSVIVGRTFPRAHGRKVRRLQRCRLPLVHGVVRDAVQPHFARAPSLLSGPLNAFVLVLRLESRPDVEEAL